MKIRARLQVEIEAGSQFCSFFRTSSLDYGIINSLVSSNHLTPGIQSYVIYVWVSRERELCLLVVKWLCVLSLQDSETKTNIKIIKLLDENRKNFCSEHNHQKKINKEKNRHRHFKNIYEWSKSTWKRVIISHQVNENYDHNKIPVYSIFHF